MMIAKKLLAKVLLKMHFFYQLVKRLLRRFLLGFYPAKLLGNLVVGPGLVLHVPLRCDGWGKVAIGRHVTLGFTPAPRLGNGGILIQARGSNAEVVIGDKTVFSNNISIIACERISLGKDCLIGNNVMIMDCDFHEIDPVSRKQGSGKAAPVLIGSNVWLGAGVTVLKGVSIGDNSVVAANSVVTKNISSNMLAAGNPAKVIRKI